MHADLRDGVEPLRISLSASSCLISPDRALWLRCKPCKSSLVESIARPWMSKDHLADYYDDYRMLLVAQSS
jgi:hypothetical protein